jgi:hypothetical protein
MKKFIIQKAYIFKNKFKNHKLRALIRSNIKGKKAKK